MKMISSLNRTLFALFTVFVFVSCVTLPCRDCVSDGTYVLETGKFPFSCTSSVLYRVSIQLYSTYFSGLLAIKKNDDGSFRMSLISETGFKLFDMEVVNGSAEMKNVFAELDRKEVRKTFMEDFSTLVLSGVSSRVCSKYTYLNQNEILFSCPEKNEISSNFLVDRGSGLLKKVWKAEDIDEQYFEINYGYAENGSMTPAFITIIHSNVKLRIELSILENK